MSVIRRHAESSEIPTFEPRLFVKVLKSADELKDALRGAALYEVQASQITGERSARRDGLTRRSTCKAAGAENTTPLTGLENGKADVGRFQAA
jgi:hypothetical protein